MSNTARSDEIDELVSSVRNLVAYKDGGASHQFPALERLMLTPALRIDAPATDFEHVESETKSVEADVLVLQNGSHPDKSSLVSTVAELEVAVTARAEDWEPDDGESFDQSSWAASAFELPQGDSGTSVTPDAADVPVAEPVPANDFATGTEEEMRDAADSELEAQIADDVVVQHVAAGIDEGALRDTVVRILREELAGDMGERITRNVRKLVRREINRVLITRDLD